ncbi:porin family protein [Aureimonas fodinaquatilis]|uniref:Porin family protein n=1 Tax=Aureimonas fodinaquatilis TaxID=2565783 RepID=A0A5B0DYA7_9HYPH|nr:outer membrane beta-barrel protein [Aureimonas fodinaquatilis]KAA0970865.1 porin family protein [Aureimonas fodinaquatilis]
MKKFLAAGFVAAMTFPAAAADVIYNEPIVTPIAALEVPSWTGFYLGVQGGGGFNPSSPDNFSIVPSFPGAFPASAFGSNYESSFGSGFVGGGHVGYDYQINNWVLGAVLDINAANLSQSQSAFSSTPAFYTAERELDYFATGRLRAGYLVTPTTLFYATGGVAYGDVSYRFSANSAPFATASAFPDSSDRWGYTVGGGMDFLVTDNISFGVEYLYTNLGDDDSYTRFVSGAFGGGVGGFTDFTGSSDFDFHTITAKISYRFN